MSQSRAANAREPKRYISPLVAKLKKQALWPSRVSETGHFLQVGSKVRRLINRVVSPIAASFERTPASDNAGLSTVFGDNPATHFQSKSPELALFVAIERLGERRKHMSETRDHGFAYDLGEALMRDLGYEYSGPERGFAEGLSFALAQSFARGTDHPQGTQQTIASELQQRGWDTNLAGAIAQGLFTASLANDYTPLTSRLEVEAQQGSIAAQLSLGVMHAEGQANLPRSPATAAKWFKQAAGTCEQGNDISQYNLGVLYYFGWGVEQSYDLAAKWFTCAATKGNVHAQFNLGIMYYHGQGVSRDYQEAAKCLTYAAQRRLACAQSSIGTLYYHGTGVEQDESTAVRWWEHAARQGWARAKNHLGLIYAKRGQHAAARASFEEAANQGLPEAQTNLGVHFQLGLSGTTDNQKARYWYEQAAAKNLPEGQYLLGQFHRDVLNDRPKGADWFTKAAQQGHAEAQNQLGLYYARLGQMEQARQWFQAASDQGHPDGRSNLARL